MSTAPLASEMMPEQIAAEARSAPPAVSHNVGSAQPVASEAAAPRAREVGGRGGLDPTRFGDWEKNGRCIDF